MKKHTFFLLIILAFSVQPLWAQDTSTITLPDGSRINGTITGMEDGKYIVDSSVGRIAIRQENVVSIVANGAQPETPQAPRGKSHDQQIDKVQQRIMSDPTIMVLLQELATDPEMLEIISDPSFMNMIQNGDIHQAQNNPKIRKLMNNPKMRILIDKLKTDQP